MVEDLHRYVKLRAPQNMTGSMITPGGDELEGKGHHRSKSSKNKPRKSLGPGTYGDSEAQNK